MRKSSPLRKILLVGAVLVAAYAGWIAVSLLLLPPVASLANPRASLVITVKDWNRKDHPFVLGPRNRFWTPISAVPASLKKAVIAAEDANFYDHEGVDYEAMREAIKTDIQKGKFARGGSTITQQVAKNVFLSREKTISRKIKELILARRLDDTLSKSRILELYLNAVELGPMIYGVGRASHYYFGKTPSALTVRESAFLASMLPGPKVYNPYRKLNRVMKRSDRILRRMYAARMITVDQYRAALAETPNISGLERKVETTMAAPPPEEKPPIPLPGREPVVLEPPPGKEAGP
ncbi:MAG TPA: monofunctional biosynthetic peptidoglycan transglycosylase, partial [Candidatus Deferrimicrobiaceae bacterium]|nr:monofunctional biosynthetic peptidoglycan transglycosylase [Candidatus Deferrimicrobiaceae bacterium]